MFSLERSKEFNYCFKHKSGIILCKYVANAGFSC